MMKIFVGIGNQVLNCVHAQVTITQKQNHLIIFYYNFIMISSVDYGLFAVGTCLKFEWWNRLWQNTIQYFRFYMREKMYNTVVCCSLISVNTIWSNKQFLFFEIPKVIFESDKVPNHLSKIWEKTHIEVNMR